MERALAVLGIFKSLNFLVLAISLSLLSGCGSLISSATSGLANDLSASIKRQKDPKTVESALPAYLILLDAMLISDEHNIGTLKAAATLNSSYASLFTDTPERQQVFTQKSLDYAMKALCLTESSACSIKSMPFKQFESVVQKIDTENLSAYYTVAASWAGWIQANNQDWNAIADLARVEKIMRRVIEVNEAYDTGNAHLYLGVITTILPSAMGGRPEQGKIHFEKAIQFSSNKNLFAKVMYAEKYARLVFDQNLHHQLIKEVINAKVEDNKLTLINIIAQKKAKQLLATEIEYFE